MILKAFGQVILKNFSKAMRNILWNSTKELIIEEIVIGAGPRRISRRQRGRL